MRQMIKAERGWTLVAWTVAGLALVFYGFHRARFAGGCDSSSYLLEALRIRGLAPGLALDPGVPVRGPLAPICLVERNGVVTSLFPPGFPVLLALGGAVGLQFFVTPLLGAASGLALYHAAATSVRPGVAFLTMVAWLGSPLVIWGSTELLSDLPAAAFSIFAVLASRKHRPLLAGLLFGFSLGIRPTQALLGPTLLVMEPRLRPRLRLALGATLSLAAALVFLRWSRGTIPLSYGVNLRWLDGAIWRTQLRFMIGQTLTLHAPVVVLAAVGLGVRRRATFPLLLWYLSYLALYTLWHWKFELWWWMRYMLPALPAVFLAAAEGVGAIGAALGGKGRWTASATAAALVFGYAGWGLFLSPAHGHLIDDFDRRYPVNAQAVGRLVPTGALVGSVNLSGPLRLYARFQSFFWCHPDAVGLVRWAIDAGRPVYTALDEGELHCNPEAEKLAVDLGYHLNLLATLPSGQTLHRLAPP
jgi:hypothetical protein